VLRLIVAELRHRRGRAIALLAGIAVATASFTVLTGASQSSRLEVRGNVAQHFRTAYDVLVRPRGATQPLERTDGLVQQAFASGTFGGISMDQYREIRRTPGIDVAAPLAVYGYVLPTATVPIPIPSGNLSPGLHSAYRIRTRWTADRGHVTVRDPDSYIYVTRRPLAFPPGHVTGSPTYILANEDLGDRGLAPVCPIASVAASPFSRAARSYLYCLTATENTNLAFGRYGLPDTGAAAAVQFPFPLLIAGIDPAAEARLSGVDRAVVSGRYLRAGDSARVNRSRQQVMPVLIAGAANIDLGAQASVQPLPAATAEAVFRAAGSRRKTATALRRARPGPTVARVTLTAQDAYDALIAQLRRPMGLDATWTTGPPRYAQRGPRHLVAQPIASDPFIWGSAYQTTGTRAGFVNVPPTTHGTGFRRLEENTATYAYNPPSPTMQAVGSFDPRKISGFGDPDVMPLDPLQAPDATVADARSRRALGSGALQPDGNMAGYLTPAPTLLTTLDAGAMLLNPRQFGHSVERQAAAPISAVRVRVRGVTGPGKASRERIRLVAERIAARTGLQVDVTAGSSETPVLVDLPASGFGRPAVSLRESWVKKGVATAILTAVDRKSLVLFLLVLLVCALFCVNATSAAVRSRATELGILACVGWPRRKLFAYLLTEVGLVGVAAGVAGTLVALPAGALLDLPVSGARALLAVPGAALLALAAGAIPARRAARGDPLEAVRPAVRSGGSARAVQTLRGLAARNLLRVPGRTVLGVVSLAVGVFALTMLLAVTTAFRGAVVGSVLGDAVAVQVRTADYVAAAATLLLGGLAVADVLYLNLRDRSAEIATLRATGWRERQLTRLITFEAAGLGVAGGAGGALLGVAAAAAFTGALTATMALVAAGAAALAVLIAILASIPPAAALRRLPTATLLAEE
jgi:putative ABC transport system permease protein